MIDMATNFAGSGALQYFRADLVNRPGIYAPIEGWAARRPPLNWLTVSPLIVFTSNTRYLTGPEQRVFQTALRNSVKVLSAGKQPIA
jgi:hypothetical protein